MYHANTAGGGAYYFAKRAINADRAARHEERMKKKENASRMEREAMQKTPSTSGSRSEPADLFSTPSEQLANMEPAPTRHLPDTKDQQVMEKTKYEASAPYESPKGNRFS